MADQETLQAIADSLGRIEKLLDALGDAVAGTALGWQRAKAKRGL